MTDFNIQELDISGLEELISYHNRCYWEKGEAEISDSTYDELIRALAALDPENPLLFRVHAPAVNSAGKVRHTSPMLSLDKAYSLEEVLAWAEKFIRSPEEMLLVEPKYDGISVNFDGRVLSTRGDGETGEMVSDKIPLIELEAPGWRGRLDRPARGELLIRNDDFINIYGKIRKKDGGVYKNPRNAVAGIMGLKDIAPMLSQGAKLTLADYSLVSVKLPFSELAGRWEDLKLELAQLPYPQDGIVIKLADEEYRESLGNTAHHPRGEIAYKFTNRSAETTLLDVEWSFGKNVLTPVAILEPVDLSGITIKRASLHNVQNIIEMDICIGDRVTVERAGDVIPYISKRIPGEVRRSAVIDSCPACGTELERRGPELVCPSSTCPETALRRLLAALRSFGIERLGEPTLRKLVEKLNIRQVSDLFGISAEKLIEIDGFKKKSAENLVGEIQRARRVEDYKVLASLNIPNVGLNIARQLLEAHSLEELRQMSVEQLTALEGVGPERAGAIAATFAGEQDYLDELLRADELVPSAGSSSGKITVCFTGKMPEKRSFYEDLARYAGYETVDSVSKSLGLLVAADVSGSGSKLVNARKAGVKIISLDEFLALTEKAPAVAVRTEPEEKVVTPPVQEEAAEKKPVQQDFFEDDLFGNLS